MQKTNLASRLVNAVRKKKLLLYMQCNSTSLLLSTVVSSSFQVHLSILCNSDINFPSSLDKIHLFILRCYSYVLPSSNKVKFYCDIMRVLKGTLFIFLQGTYFTSLFLFIYLRNTTPVLASRSFFRKAPFIYCICICVQRNADSSKQNF